MSRRALAVILLLSWIATACASVPATSPTSVGATIESASGAAGVPGADSPSFSEPATTVDAASATAPPVTPSPRQAASATALTAPPAATATAASEPEAEAEGDEATSSVRTDLQLDSAGIGFESLIEESGPVPVSLAIESLDIDDADVIAVGVNDDETFEVPPADQVGWYEFGPAPGEAGSAVLAAHINFDGVDGVFRHLIDAEVGSIVEIGFDDGTSQRYRIESVTDYVKEALPAELFARSGDASLALITCGGEFHPQLRSYDSNTVAIAVPL